MMLTEIELKNLVASLSLEEKVGQMIQLNESFVDGSQEQLTGPVEAMQIDRTIPSLIGSVLGMADAQKIQEVQTKYIEQSRHKIPLLFMADVIHGYRTILPIPLAQACSFDPDLVEKGARMSAAESIAGGQTVHFSPMCDLTRDPRWGRVIESTGEDHWLNGLYASAITRGYQKNDLKRKDSVASCVKHFAAYGAVEGGRDYNTVDMSERTLREFYLPSYKKAIDTGCAMVMTAFVTIDGIPSTANKWLLRDLLRGEWGFEGVVISDWNAIFELIAHGVAADAREAAKLAIEAGVDIDMMSPCYANHLAELVRSKEVPESMIDEAVMRILRLKNMLGLFDFPYHGADAIKEQEISLCAEHKEIACEIAQRSMVLLKNNNLLPLSPNTNKIALIGPYAIRKHILGGWSCLGEEKEVINLAEVMTKQFGSERISIADGCDIDTDRLDLDHIDQAIMDANVVVLAIGEHPDMSGEAGSRGMIDIPGRQLELCRYVFSKDIPCVVVLFNGRPLDLREINDKADALLEVWFPGTEGSRAIMDLIFGYQSPKGRLTMSFPYTVGQIPVYYNCFNTGRPKTATEDYFCTGYLDLPNEPLFPFGYGLSYTQFEYGNVELSSSVLQPDHSILASISVRNIGNLPGWELVQMYLRDLTASVVRPICELKDFQWVYLNPGEVELVSFELTIDQLRFYDAAMHYTIEAGKHLVLIGPNSRDIRQAEFRLDI